MIAGLDHIGIGIRDIERSLKAVCEVLGLPEPAIEDLPERKAKVALLDLGGAKLEFIQDDSEDGLLARFVREKGEGIHHFCMLTDDIHEEVEKLKSRGVEMIHQQPRLGLRGKLIAFISPDSLGGIHCELSEP